MAEMGEHFPEGDVSPFSVFFQQQFLNIDAHLNNHLLQLNAAVLYHVLGDLLSEFTHRFTIVYEQALAGFPVPELPEFCLLILVKEVTENNHFVQL